jgi:hypothetical protein
MVAWTIDGNLGETIMRKVLILSVTAMTVVATSQAFAMNLVKQQATATTAAHRDSGPSRPITAIGKLPAVNRPITAIGKAAMPSRPGEWNGDLKGVGVPGGLSRRGAGSDIAKGAGFKDNGITAKSVLGAAKEGVKGAKDTANQNKGVQKSDGATVRQTEAMKKALGAAPGSKVVGVNPTEGASVRQTEAMKKALGEAPGNRVVGVNPHDDSVHLSREQRKALRDALVNPGVNHDNQTEQKKKDLEAAKHVFDFAKPKENKPLVMPPLVIKVPPPKPPK